MDAVEVTVWGIVPGQGGQSLILVDSQHQRLLPIVIGIPEALAILFELKDRKFERPMTHDLFIRTFDALGVEVDSVLISDLRDATFHALLNLRRAGRAISVDARSSDAVAIALRAGVPILVAESVMSQAAHSAESAQQEEWQGDTPGGPTSLDELGLGPASYEEVERFRDILRDAGLDEIP